MAISTGIVVMKNKLSDGHSIKPHTLIRQRSPHLTFIRTKSEGFWNTYGSDHQDLLCLLNARLLYFWDAKSVVEVLCFAFLLIMAKRHSIRRSILKLHI